MTKKKCRICGCTEDNNPICIWIDEERTDLCSFCADRHRIKGSFKNNERIMISGKMYQIEHHTGKNPTLRRVIILVHAKNRRN